MRLTLKLGLLGIALVLATVPAFGSDPIARPVVGTPRPPDDPPNLGYLFPQPKRPASASIAQQPPSLRDDALTRTQIPPEAPRLPGRLPSSPPPDGAAGNAPPAGTPGNTLPNAPAPAPVLPAPAGMEANAAPVAPLSGAEVLPGQSLPPQGAADPNAALAGFDFLFPPPMIGDQAPFSLRSPLSSGAGAVPALPPSPFGPQRTAIALPWARGFKIADNMSPRPMDRVFFTFNYFNNLDGSINSRLAPGAGAMQAYRYLFGYEKTFWDGNASVGLRLPLDTLNINGQGTNTALGNLTVFTKLILWQQQGTPNLISGGVAVTAPTGPASFGGAPGVFGYRDAQIQPFLGYVWSRGRFYFQGFEAIDVPTDPHDVTMQYNDLGIGYFAYRDADPHAFLSAIAPTFETHVNIPLNHVGAFRNYDPAGTPNVVDLTFGVNMLFRQRSMLTLAFVNPVTGPRPFNQEWTILFNYFFGRTRPMIPAVIPPVAGL